MITARELREQANKCRVPQIKASMINAARAGQLQITMPRKKLTNPVISKLRNRGFTVTTEQVNEVPMTTISWAE